LKTKRNGYMKVLAQGRQGQSIYDELTELLPLPKIFEQAYPFEWPAGPDAEVPDQEPSTVEDDEFVALTAPLEDEPPTDEELVEFWANQTTQKRKHPKRGPDGKLVASDD